MVAEKICFVIGPIGEEGSDTRKRSDTVLQHVIRPVALECGYSSVLRADQIARPGIVTVQIVKHLVEGPLVVADLTDHNANVFYELAIRHVVRKPLVLLIEAGQPLPFDISPSRVIKLDHKDLDSAARAKIELAEHIKSAEADPELVDNPITTAVDLEALRKGLRPHDLELARFFESTLTAQADLARLVASLQAEVRTLRQELLGSLQPPPMLSPLSQMAGTLSTPVYPWARRAATQYGYFTSVPVPDPSLSDPPAEGGIQKKPGPV